MVMTDPIADFLARLRNAIQAHHDSFTLPYSRIKHSLAEVLKREGYLQDVNVEGEGVRKQLVIHIRYLREGRFKRQVLTHIQRISKPGRRIYVPWREIPRVRQGLGTAVLSTSHGILSDKQARRLHTGGELLCILW